MADASRSDAGGWSGEGFPQHGDFLRPRPAGNVHIAETVLVVTPRSARVDFACGKSYNTAVLDPADGDHGRQCQTCWDTF